MKTKFETHLIYATSNPGKIIEIGRHFGFYGLSVLKLSEFSPVKLKPDETGISLGENALIKARAYAKTLSEEPNARGQRFIVIADDSGPFIDALNGEPGIRVRRWKGYEMTDQEIIDYTLERMKDVPEGKRTATFRIALCMVQVDEKGAVCESVVTEGMLVGRILEVADKTRIEGFPFESLFFATEYNLLLGGLHRLSDEEKRAGKFNHRERAIEKAIPVIKAMMNE